MTEHLQAQSAVEQALPASVTSVLSPSPPLSATAPLLTAPAVSEQRSLAPWLNGKLTADLTPDELVQDQEYRQSVKLADSEFEASVKVQGGPLIQKETIASRATAVLPKDKELLDKTRVRGFTVPNSAKSLATLEDKVDRPLIGNETTKERLVRKYGPVFKSAGLDPEKEVTKALDSEQKSIFTIGAKGANKEVTAHEFMHVAVDVFRSTDVNKIEDPIKRKAATFIKDNIPSKKGERDWNHEFDRYRSTDGQAWIQDVIGDTNFAKSKGMIKTNDEIRKFAINQFKFYKGTINRRANTLARMEAASQVLKGVPAPEGTTWKEFYFKQYLMRKKRAVANAEKELATILGQ